jgi:hypothetical protein
MALGRETLTFRQSLQASNSIDFGARHFWPMFTDKLVAIELTSGDRTLFESTLKEHQCPNIIKPASTAILVGPNMHE